MNTFLSALLPSKKTKQQDGLNIVEYQQKTKQQDVLNILVLGETGAGKSTLINTITNYFKKGNLNNLLIAIPTKFLCKTEKGFKADENDVKNTTSSKTNSCNIYQFSLDDKVYSIIDTPGLSDTRGTTQDDENLDKIIEAAEQVGHLSAIVVVINGTTPRMTVNLQNVFTRLRGNVPDVLFSNLLVVFTNCLPHTCNFDIESLGMTPKESFYMNNSAFSSNPKNWTVAAREHLSIEWNSSMKEIKRAMDLIATMAATITTAFGDMKHIRFEIKQTLHGVRLQIKQLQDLQDHLDAAQTALGKYSNDEDQFKAYTRQKTMTYTEMADAPYHSTICSNCSSICHDHCGLHEISTKGSNAFRGCICMRGNACTVCEGRCSYVSHYHARKTMVTKEKTIDEVLHDMKAKYDAANQGKTSQMQQITTTKSAKEGVEKAIENTTIVLRTKCKALKQICSGFNLVDELNAMINQLKTESRGLQSIDARNTANAFIKTIEQLCDTLSPSVQLQQLSLEDASTSDAASSDEESREESSAEEYKMITTQSAQE